MFPIKDKGAKSIKTIAIIGSGYAGLTFANLIQARSDNIHVQIYEALSVPNSGVLVGNVEVPFAATVFDVLGLQWKWRKNAFSIPEEELLAALRSRLTKRINYRSRAVALGSTLDGIYVKVQNCQEPNSPCCKEGPFDIVVASNGVRSIFRGCDMDRVALIGDSRWVQARWWDLGTRRLREGADIAMRDALALGNIVLNHDVKQGSLHLEEFSARKHGLPLWFIVFSVLVALCATFVSTKKP
jgi:2-polyprenyl-6-methoxyphenol hydroxylase-like FAD-dependent oxidoreductase